MQAWKQNDNTSFNFYDAHDLTNIMKWSSEETIKASLRERLANTKVFILLVGEKTKYHTKFVKWEIEQAMKRDIPIIVVNLNGKRYKDEQLCPPVLDGQLAVHISFNQKMLTYALTSWENLHHQYRKQGASGDYRYNDQTYASLGL